MSSAPNDFGRDHGLIHEVVVTGSKAGWDREDWAKLTHDVDFMRQIREVRLGRASIVAAEHVIDCDADPFLPTGWRVKEHQKGGKLTWDPCRVQLYLSQKQRNGEVRGSKVCEELGERPKYNANVLDHLLAHPHLIPAFWANRYVCFWGTEYRDQDHVGCVRCLCWSGGRPIWRGLPIDYAWNGSIYAALHVG